MRRGPRTRAGSSHVSSVCSATPRSGSTIQVIVADLTAAGAAAEHARDAGFVRVPGEWTGLDRRGTQFGEVVLVDADPGRPTNVNLRPVGDPVWRETLLFRDWLVADVANRDRYLAFKRTLVEATQNIDEYSSGKLPWIGDALGVANRWAEAVGWQPANSSIIEVDGPLPAP